MQENSAQPSGTSGRQVTRAHKRGRTRTQIAQEVGLSYTAVSKTIARFESQGLAGLAPRTRGRRSGEDRALSVEQEQAISPCGWDTTTAVFTPNS